MSTLAQAVPSKAPTSRPGLWSRVQTHLAQLNAAHDRQTRFAHLNGSEARDTGLPPEVLLAEPAHADALPFFLQSGFGRDQETR